MCALSLAMRKQKYNKVNSTIFLINTINYDNRLDNENAIIVNLYLIQLLGTAELILNTYALSSEHMYMYSFSQLHLNDVFLAVIINASRVPATSLTAQ